VQQPGVGGCAKGRAEGKAGAASVGFNPDTSKPAPVNSKDQVVFANYNKLILGYL
jgi:hypothetical protein